MYCLFCEAEEQNYLPVPDTDFICSRCVQVMTNADQDDLKRHTIRPQRKGTRERYERLRVF
jgi:hypothetical protein